MNRALALALLLVSGRAAALDPRFGARGQTVLTTRASASLSYTTFEAVDAQSFATNFSPSFDYFVLPHVSIGADASGFFQWSRSGAETTYGGASLTLRGGFDVPLGRWASLWPELEISLAWDDLETAGVGQTEVGPTATLFVPLLLHLRSHLFVGVGPSIAHGFFAIRSGGSSVGDDRTNVTFGTILGGYTGGEKSPRDDGVPIRWRPFGAEHEIVIEGGALFDWLTDQRFGTSTVSLAASAYVAYFFFEDVSLGLAAGGSYARNDAPATTNGPRTTESGGGFVAPRFGYVLPISDRFSFYPNVSIAFGAIGTTAGSSFTIDLGMYAQVLYHVAPHFFVGAGPAVDLGLFAEDGHGQSEARSTSVGAALSIGGRL